MPRRFEPSALRGRREDRLVKRLACTRVQPNRAFRQSPCGVTQSKVSSGKKRYGATGAPACVTCLDGVSTPARTVQRIAGRIR